MHYALGILFKYKSLFKSMSRCIYYVLQKITNAGIFSQRKMQYLFFETNFLKNLKSIN